MKERKREHQRRQKEREEHRAESGLLNIYTPQKNQNTAQSNRTLPYIILKHLTDALKRTRGIGGGRRRNNTTSISPVDSSAHNTGYRVGEHEWMSC